VSCTFVHCYYTCICNYINCLWLLWFCYIYWLCMYVYIYIYVCVCVRLYVRVCVFLCAWNCVETTARISASISPFLSGFLCDRRLFGKIWYCAYTTLPGPCHRPEAMTCWCCRVRNEQMIVHRICFVKLHANLHFFCCSVANVLADPVHVAGAVF